MYEGFHHFLYVMDETDFFLADESVAYPDEKLYAEDYKKRV